MSTSLASPPIGRAWRAWPVERILFAMAGVMTLVAAVAAALLSPWWLLLAGFVGLNQIAFATTGHCGASLILTRMGVARGCPR